MHDALPRQGFALLVFVDALAHPKQAEALLETPALAGSPVEVLLVGSVRGLVSLNASPTRRVIDADGVLADRFAAESFPLYLVRPDEHVAARLRDAEPEAVAAALGVALGRLPRGTTTSAGSIGAGDTELPRADAAPHGTDGDGRETLGQTGLERVFEAVSQGVDAAGAAEAPEWLRKARPTAS